MRMDQCLLLSNFFFEGIPYTKYIVKFKHLNTFLSFVAGNSLHDKDDIKNCKTINVFKFLSMIKGKNFLKNNHEILITFAPLRIFTKGIHILCVTSHYSGYY